MVWGEEWSQDWSPWGYIPAHSRDRKQAYQPFGGGGCSCLTALSHLFYLSLTIQLFEQLCLCCYALTSTNHVVSTEAAILRLLSLRAPLGDTANRKGPGDGEMFLGDSSKEPCQPHVLRRCVCRHSLNGCIVTAIIRFYRLEFRLWASPKKSTPQLVDSEDKL